MDKHHMSTPMACQSQIAVKRPLCDEEVAFYQAQDYVLIPGLIDAAAAAALREEVLEILSVQGPIGAGRRKLYQTHEYLAGGGIDRLCNGSDLNAIAAKLMGGPSTLYLPFTAVKAPGGGRFHFHQDNQYTRFDGPGINMWIALEVLTPENGCLQVAPGSHRTGTLPSVLSGDGDNHRKVEKEPLSFIPIPMQPGDCLAFSRLMVHGSGPNNTAAPRIAYAAQFHRNDVKAKWDDGWFPLIERPRYNYKPVEKITPPTGKLDGH
jgi:hypothetical protein